MPSPPTAIRFATAPPLGQQREQMPRSCLQNYIIILVSKLHSGTSNTMYMPLFLEASLCNLLTSICNFVPCDRVLPRAYLDVDLLSGACVAIEKNLPDNACLSTSNTYFWTASWKTSHSCSKTACRAQGRECNNTIAHCVFSTLDKIWPDSSFPLKNDCNRSLKFWF